MILVSWAYEQILNKLVKIDFDFISKCTSSLAFHKMTLWEMQWGWGKFLFLLLDIFAHFSKYTYFFQWKNKQKASFNYHENFHVQYYRFLCMEQ